MRVLTSDIVEQMPCIHVAIVIGSSDIDAVFVPWLVVLEYARRNLDKSLTSSTLRTVPKDTMERAGSAMLSYAATAIGAASPNRM